MDKFMSVFNKSNKNKLILPFALHDSGGSLHCVRKTQRKDAPIVNYTAIRYLVKIINTDQRSRTLAIPCVPRVPP